MRFFAQNFSRHLGGSFTKQKLFCNGKSLRADCRIMDSQVERSMRPNCRFESVCRALSIQLFSGPVSYLFMSVIFTCFAPFALSSLLAPTKQRPLRPKLHQPAAKGTDIPRQQTDFKGNPSPKAILARLLRKDRSICTCVDLLFSYVEQI